MITSTLTQEQINKSIELLNKIRTDDGELFPQYVNEEYEKYEYIQNGVVRFFDDGKNTGIFASLIYWGLFRIFIAFEKDTDEYATELAELIELVKAKNPDCLPKVYFIAEHKQMINAIMKKTKFQPPLPNGFYYSSHEFVMDKEHFKEYPNDKHLEIRPYEARRIEDYALLLDNAMTFASPPTNFRGNISGLAEKVKEKALSAFYKNDELVGLYWFDNDYPFYTIDFIAVAPAHQRKGYGSIILSHAINNVLTYQKMETAKLYCVDWNEKGLSFYKKFGMILKGHMWSASLAANSE